MKRTLIVATTVFHVIVAVQMKRTILKSHEVDIICGDETPNMKDVAYRLEKLDVFNQVYFVNMNSYNKQLDNYVGYSARDYVMKKNYDIKKMFTVKRKYDLYLYPFFHHFHINLYSYMKKYINPHIRGYLYEEGVAIYSAIGRIREKKLSEYEEDFWFRNFKYGNALKEISGIITFNPDLFQWGKEYNKIKIPKINRYDKELRNIYNKIFNYNSKEKKEYEKKVIFFEEAKNQDGLKNNDVSIVDKVSRIVGRNNILVKLHPRSEKNRFKQLGCMTNNNSIVPWEVVYMNNRFEDTIFMSTASSSIAHPMLIFGEYEKGIFLFKLVHSILPDELQMQEKFLENVIVKKYEKYLVIPDTMEELEGFIGHS